MGRTLYIGTFAIDKVDLMNIKALSSDSFSIEASRREIRIIKDCILNLDNFTGEDAFDTYVGASKSEAKNIMHAISSALRSNPI